MWPMYHQFGACPFGVCPFGPLESTALLFLFCFVFAFFRTDPRPPGEIEAPGRFPTRGACVPSALLVAEPWQMKHSGHYIDMTQILKLTNLNDAEMTVSASTSR